jgi:hypothetical protein
MSQDLFVCSNFLYESSIPSPRYARLRGWRGTRAKSSAPNDTRALLMFILILTVNERRGTAWGPSQSEVTQLLYAEVSYVHLWRFLGVLGNAVLIATLMGMLSTSVLLN